MHPILDVLGREEAVEALTAAPDIYQKAIRAATEDTLGWLVLDAQGRANRSRKTGNLVDHIGYRKPTAKSTFGVIGIGKGSVTIDGRRMRASHYAHLVEFGFMHAKAKRRTEAKPFILPSVEGRRAYYAKQVARQANEAVAKIAAIGMRAPRRKPTTRGNSTTSGML